MGSKRILYISPLVNDELEQKLDIREYSPAGQAQQRTSIKSLLTAGYHVSVLSPLSSKTDEFGLIPSTDSPDAETSVVIHVPYSLNILPLCRTLLPTSLIKPLQEKFLLPLFTILFLRKLLQEDNVDTILFYNYNIITAFPAFYARVFHGIPIILDYNDSRLDSPHLLDRLRDKFYFHTIDPWIAGAVCINSNMSENLKTNNITVIRGQPSIGILDESCDSHSQDGGLKIMYGGRLDCVRGVQKIIEAAPTILSEIPEVEIWIAGYGPLYEDVGEKIEQIESSRIQFLGNLSNEEYKERLVLADIALNLQSPQASGNRYTFPTKVLDYMASKNVIISTRIADLEDNFGDLMVFTDPSVEQITAQIVIVCRNYQNYSQYSRDAFRWVAENCTFESFSEKMDVLLREVTRE